MREYILCIVFMFLFIVSHGQNTENEGIKDDTLPYIPSDFFYKDTFSKEPVIYTDNYHKEIYRFKESPSYGNISITVRIEKQGNKYRLYWKVHKRIGYNKWRLYINRQKKLNEKTWIEFKKRLNQADFWNMETDEKIFGLDGWTWALEGKTDSLCHIVNRWCPREETKYYKCCDFLIKLTDLEKNRKYIKRNRKYRER